LRAAARRILVLAIILSSYYSLQAEPMVSTVDHAIAIDSLSITKAVCSLSSSQYSALQDFYLSTHGESWCIDHRLKTDSKPWNFSSGSMNSPCEDAWIGITCNPCTSASSAYNILKLELTSCCLSGSISSSIDLLSALQTLELRTNFDLVGYIPSSISSMTQLTTISLSANNLHGNIPNFLFQMKQLQTLNLESNLFTGRIPATIGESTSIVEFTAFSNMITGSLSSLICNLTSAERLILYDNQFTNTLPSCIFNMKTLRYLWLYHNSFHGPIPSFQSASSLQDLRVQMNRLTGSIPSSIENAYGLYVLYVNDNHLTSSLPTSLGNLIHLSDFNPSNNVITGTIPSSYSQLQNLSSLQITVTSIGGTFPEVLLSLSSLRTFSLASNEFHGPLPSNIDQFSSLWYFYININQWTGTIPSSICNITTLLHLDVSSNLLDGSIPSCMENIALLYDAELNGNYLTGSIPMFGKALYSLDAMDNYLTGNVNNLGNFPCIACFTCELTTVLLLENSNALNSLFLDSNLLSGTIANSTISDFMQYLSISNNKLSGVLPPSFKSIRKLHELVLNDNELSGDIFSLLANSQSKDTLVTINLSTNKFTGSLPGGLNFSNVLLLYSSSNCITSELPKSLCTGRLQALDFSAIGDGENCEYNYPSKPLSSLLPSIFYGKQFGLQGRIPDCYLQLPHLETLNLAGK
jgi:Leucine-rich repeat (LRR) protein